MSSRVKQEREEGGIKVGKMDKKYRLQQYLKWKGGCWEVVYYVLTEMERELLFDRLREKIEQFEVLEGEGEKMRWDKLKEMAKRGDERINRALRRMQELRKGNVKKCKKEEKN